MPLRLKHLELNGYKSFASKADFMFSEGISAIVGPNGSGKSNVVDGIRWVLGEQSYSLLRGKKTEDMIFAGSDKRARAGMAQVTLTFDNSDGWLPIEFSEVAISRRAHRDGSNDYLLNGQKVRLKDIHELLARCGLAERTYTIIGQGLIDNALALKAEERRALFEEAAGIGLYRDRREDSLRKLDATQRNLDRVLDILEEIRPRLASLERQAKRARDYHVVKRELDSVLRVWYGYHWRRALAAVDTAVAAAAQAEAELAAHQARQAEFDVQVGGLRARAQELRRALNDTRSELDAARAERESLARELAVAEERARSLAAQRDAAQAELPALQAELAEQTEALHTAREELARVEAEIAQARNDLATAEAIVHSGESARETLIRREQQARAALANAEHELVSLRARAGHLRERRQALSESHETARAEVDRLLADEAAARARVTELAQAFTVRQQARIAAEAAVADAQAQIRSAEAAQLAAAQDVMRAHGELDRLQARQELMQQARAELAGFAAGARALKAADFPTHGVLGDMVEVPAEYEAAISAALGGYAEGLVVDDHHHAEEGLNALGSEHGRAALLPIRSLNGTHKVSAPNADGVLGVAVDLLADPGPLRPLLTSVLGNTVVVRDRDVARSVLEAVPYYATVVTLSGELFHAAGPVVGGRDGAPSALEAARVRRDLTAEITASAEALASAEARSTQAVADVANANAALKAAQQALREAQDVERRAAVTRDSAALDAERAAQAAQTRRRALDQALQEAQQLTASIDAAESQIQTQTQVRDAAQAASEAAGRDLAGYTAEDAGATLARAKAAAALAEQSVANARERAADRARAHGSAERAVAERMGRVERAEAEIAQRAEADAAARLRVTELDDIVARASAALDPLAAELSALEGDQTRLEAGDAESRGTLHAAEKHNTDAQLEAARKQAELDNLRLRIEEDFGLVELEYTDASTGPTPLPFEALVDRLEALDELPEGVEEQVNRRRNQMRRMGAINPDAEREYTEVRERHDFLTTQVGDLQSAQAQLRDVITEMDGIMEREFKKTLEEVGGHFTHIFAQLFGGGSAKLMLTDPLNPNTSGVDISCKLPGKKAQGLSMLSGGERSLTACALVFALLKVSPTPFCVLDEVDAMLDEANVGRYRDMLNELGQTTQFIIVTHNRNTVQVADTVYGITMGVDSASQMISLKLDGERIAQAADRRHEFAALAA